MIVMKAEKKGERPDYGNTITPKQAAVMLTFLTDEVDIVSTEGLCARPRDDAGKRHALCIRPKVFRSGRSDKRLSRYELSDVCCMRDCLSVLLGKRNGPANCSGTRTYTITKNDPLYSYVHKDLQCLDPCDKSKNASEMRRTRGELDVTLGGTLEFYRCHLEAKSGVVMIVPDDDRGW